MLEDFFAEITDSLPEPYLLLTQTGDIICTNLAARKKFSLTKNMTGNLNLNTLMEDDPAKHKQLLQMWSRSKSPLPGGLTRKNGDGTAVKYLCKGNTIRPAQNGESAIIFLHCTDKKQSTAVFLTLNEKVELLKREIAERRKAEQEILSLNEDLEQRVKRRTAELLQLNSELNNSIEELKSTQDQLVRTERLASLGSMVAGVAHEINTPVGVCVTAVTHLESQAKHYNKLYEEGTLTRKDFESLLNTAIESTKIMHGNLDRTADLVRSFKQLAVDQTSDEQRHINIKNYLEELMISLKPLFRDLHHRIELVCPDDINIESQPGAIAQIFSNLINNSIVHGFEEIEEGEIKMQIERDKENILFHYCDNGHGMTQEILQHIFDPFFTTRRDKGGSGLGMSIVYNLVTNQLNGKIRVTSEPHQGIHFYISLPYNHQSDKANL